MTVVNTDDPVVLYKINERYKNVKLCVYKVATEEINVTNFID